MRLFASAATLAMLTTACGANVGSHNSGGTTTTGTTTSSASAASSGAGASGVGGAGTTTVSSSSSGAGGAVTSGSTSSSSAASSSSSGASSSSTAASSSSSGGTPTGSGDCNSDADCPGGACVALVPGGFRVCAEQPPMATSCTHVGDQCCASKPCPSSEACYLGPLVPSCGPPQVPHNQCAVDQCEKDVDCAAGQICAPAGALGLKIRACINAHCKVDTDCTASPGGMCAPVQNPCCAATDGLFCVYPSNGGCRKTADCGPGRYCVPNTSTGVAACQSGGPICP